MKTQGLSHRLPGPKGGPYVGRLGRCLRRLCPHPGLQAARAQPDGGLRVGHRQVKWEGTLPTRRPEKQGGCSSGTHAEFLQVMTTTGAGDGGGRECVRFKHGENVAGSHWSGYPTGYRGESRPAVRRKRKQVPT